MELSEAEDEMRRLSRLIDAGIEMLREQSHALAESESAYRKARSKCWVQVPEGMLAKEKEAWVDAETADECKARDIAQGMRQAALEAIRARRQQLSAWQSLVAAHKAEADFDRTGPR